MFSASLCCLQCSHTITIHFPLVIKDYIITQISRTSISNPGADKNKYRPGGWV